jgi:hypothetical protein
MACCGSRRQQLSSLQQRRFLEPVLTRVPPAAAWGADPPAPVLPPVPDSGGSPGASPGGASDQDGLVLLYLGAAALALRSPLTGRPYRLEPGVPFWVPRQDGDLLLATGLCRRA